MRCRVALAMTTVTALAVSGCGAQSTTSAGSAGVTSLVPVTNTVPARFGAGFYGVNYDYTGASEFAKAGVDPLLAQLEPGTLRWPGGTEADHYDWHTGTTAPHAYSFTLTNLRNACEAAGAAPIFDLDVLTPANRTNPADQVGMLRAAQQLKLPISRVEIGNELYGGGAFQQAFPDGTAYGKTVAAYVKALHHDFPGVQVAADAVLHPTTTRQRQWNSEMLAAATGSGAPDAVIMHDYPGLTDDPFTSADLPALFADASTSIGTLATATGTVGGKPVWLTEYNFRGPYVPPPKRKPNPIVTSYAHELYEAYLALMLPRVHALALVDNWTAVADGATFGAWTTPSKPALSPGGQAVELIDTAAHGAASTAVLTVPGVPTLPNGAPAVTGQVFSSPGNPTTALLVNLTGATQQVPVGGAIQPGVRYQRSAGTPTAQQAVAAPLTSGTVPAGGFPLPPYSITMVGTTTGAM
jgi:hypothetical protein